MKKMEYIFLFHNPISSKFCGGAFTQRQIAEAWIRDHKLSGVLTKYPVDTGVYDWAVRKQVFIPKKNEHYERNFIAGFTSASQEHYHYEDGECID
ncbi:MAG: hypothetical protein SFU87_10110 [Chitinophagaceae bacterium]|nr:hypothetical protein [Chitinophagaceae bacterium]